MLWWCGPLLLTLARLPLWVYSQRKWRVSEGHLTFYVYGALFSVTETWDQCACLLVDEYKKEMRCAYAQNNLSTINKNDNL